MLGTAIDQIPVPAEGVDGSGILQKRKPCRDQQYTARRTAQDRFKRKTGKQTQVQPVAFGHAHADKVDDEEHCLPCKEKVIVQQVQCRPERKTAIFAVQHRVIQRCQHVREESRGIQKEIEENIIDVEAAESVENAAHDAPFLTAHPAAHPEISTAARHRKFQAEHGHHRKGHPTGRQENGQPEKGRAQAIIGIGVDEPAAQVGGPAEGTAPLDKVVGIGVERDHLVVEIARIMKKSAGESVNDTVRQKQHSRQRQAKPEHLPVAGAARTQRQQWHGKTLLPGGKNRFPMPGNVVY